MKKLIAGDPKLISCMQDFYKKYNKIPPMRIFIKFYNEHYANDNNPITSMDLYKLYPEQPMHELCKQAGLPAPDSCI